MSVALNEGGRLFCVILNRRSEFPSMNHANITNYHVKLGDTHVIFTSYHVISDDNHLIIT
jgi:hypothetical protein